MPSILEAYGLVRSFGGFRAVDGVDLKVRRGSIHALIGPNGAGKTTCFNLLTRFLDATAGTIVFDGHDVSSLSSDAVARLGMVRSFQISAVFGRLPVFENIRLAVQRQGGSSFNFWTSDRTLQRHNARACELLDEVGLAPWAQERADALPYGRKRILELATTLALEPRLLLLDEPMAGMGAEDINHACALIRKAAQGRTVLMVEHNLSVVADLCDTITVLAQGKVLAQGDYAAISHNEEVTRAYLGGAGKKRSLQAET